MLLALIHGVRLSKCPSSTVGFIVHIVPIQNEITSHKSMLISICIVRCILNKSFVKENQLSKMFEQHGHIKSYSEA